MLHCMNICMSVKFTLKGNKEHSPVDIAKTFYTIIRTMAHLHTDTAYDLWGLKWQLYGRNDEKKIRRRLFTLGIKVPCCPFISVGGKDVSYSKLSGLLKAIKYLKLLSFIISFSRQD